MHIRNAILDHVQVPNPNPSPTAIAGLPSHAHTWVPAMFLSANCILHTISPPIFPPRLRVVENGLGYCNFPFGFCISITGWVSGCGVLFGTYGIKYLYLSIGICLGYRLRRLPATSVWQRRVCAFFESVSAYICLNCSECLGCFPLQIHSIKQTLRIGFRFSLANWRGHRKGGWNNCEGVELGRYLRVTLNKTLNWGNILIELNYKQRNLPKLRGLFNWMRFVSTELIL